MSRNFHKKNKDGLSDRSRKIIVLALSVFSVAAIFFGFWKINDSIYSPFYLGEKFEAEETITKTGPTNCSGLYCVDETEAKSKDSDNDGLSDWEEINIYLTSPYLEDTDGDGISDLDEILGGTDPNCPEGKDCSTTLVDYYGKDSLNRSLDEMQIIEEKIYSELEAKEDKVLENMLSGSLNTDSLRQLLISGGLEKDVVEAFSEQELIDLYTEVLQESKE